MALPPVLTVGPRWIPLALVVALTAPTVFNYRHHYHRLHNILGQIMSGSVTAFLVTSVALLMHAIPAHTLVPAVLLRSAVALWLTNVLIFGLWYWRLDAGGPHLRGLRSGHEDGDFLFPQMIMAARDDSRWGRAVWSPGFWDYLFLAFNTSTAFSPTDTAALSVWAKMLMMLQSSISLAVIAFLAARAVNIL